MFFEHVEQHLNSMLGSSFIADFRLTEIGPSGVVTCSRGSPGESTGSYTFKVRESVENNTLPIPPIVRFFLKNERNFGGNQLPDGSIGLSPLPKRAFARDSPGFAF